jgi:hypothetical protein
MTILDIPADAYAEDGSSGETEYALWLCTIMDLNTEYLSD